MLEKNRQTKSRADGYLILDDTGNPKSGTATFATQRQYIGSLGKGDTGQVVVTSHSADESKDWPIDLQPYLPQKWIQEENQRREQENRTKPPEKQKALLTFRPKWELGLQLIAAAIEAEKGGELAFSHILVDGWYGNSPRFIQGLEERKKLYITTLYQNRRVYYHLPGEPARNEHYLKDGVARLGERNRVF